MIPISALFERVILGYPHLYMLKIAHSGLLNAEIEHSDLDKLMEALFFTAAAALLRIPSRLARHGALSRRAQDRRLQPPALICQSRGRLVCGVGTILSCCWRRSG